jgi:hypothetical protein
LDTPFVGHSRAMRESPGFAALNLAARRVLDFIELEHLAHGGTDNGNLMAPYAQLEKTGISSRDIRPAIEMLTVFGFIRRTDAGERLGGRPNAATYALTFYPTFDGTPPTEDFRIVTLADVKFLLAERSTHRERLRQRRP